MAALTHRVRYVLFKAAVNLMGSLRGKPTFSNKSFNSMGSSCSWFQTNSRPRWLNSESGLERGGGGREWRRESDMRAGLSELMPSVLIARVWMEREGAVLPR